VSRRESLSLLSAYGYGTPVDGFLLDILAKAVLGLRIYLLTGYKEAVFGF